MAFRNLDLNLLVVFDAVMTERSATRAANRLHMSQPAVSHAMARLRHALKDELFVRSPEGMVPTPLAERLAPTIRQSLAELCTVFEVDTFDPATSDHRFRVAVNNFAAIVLVPAVIEAAASAPGVHIDIRPSGTLDVPTLLDRGDLDLAIVNAPVASERFASLMLAAEPFVALMRNGHPATAGLTIQTLAQYPHLVISSSTEDIGFIEKALAEEGLERRIGVNAPFLSTPGILRNSDMIAIVSRGIAAGFADVAPLTSLPLPFPTPAVTVSAVWHRRYDKLAAHLWLRDLFLRSAGRLGRAASQQPKIVARSAKAV